MNIKELIYLIPAILIAVSLHEFAHGYVSYKLGDPTPKATGRLSLNPLAHLDPVGTICLLFFHFGWAKPVQVNPYYYKDKRRGMALVGLAGPMMNFLIALICAFAIEIILKVTGGYGGDVILFMFNLFNYTYIINIGLGVFNLIPFPPLDGAKIIGALLPEEKYFKFMKYERYGQLIIFALLMSNFLDGPLMIARKGIDKIIWGIVNLFI
ncbi:site-2 protease family protein [uncultured Clostridium sp.]|uniref:site-2 protease family protein n=1 Tax=uncultured Clostridium sp. TaxID=59620 RepID=UPI0032178954